MKLTFLGAAGSVTGSCYMLETGRARLLLECGQVQGTRQAEARNRDPLPVRLEDIDAVVLSHAHIDHSGRLPLLRAQGYRGPIHTHDASRALCEIMLYDSAYLHEKDAEWENRRRARKGLPAVRPLYTRDDATAVMDQFRSVPYDERTEILPGIEIRLRDAQDQERPAEGRDRRRIAPAVLRHALGPGALVLIAQRHPGLVVQPGPRHALHVRRRHRLDGRQIPVRGPRIVLADDGLPQNEGPARRGLALAQFARHDLGLGLGSVAKSVETSDGETQTETDGGLAIVAGAGVDVFQRGIFAVDLELALSRTRGDQGSMSVASLQLAATWY